jgi:hypothetical protein
MRHHRNMRRWLGWIAVVAILGNMAAGALGHARAQGAASLDDPFGAHLMCIGRDAAQPQVPGGGGDPDQKTAHCVLCTLLAGFALAATVAFAAIAFPAACAFRPLRFDLPTLADHLNLGGIRSRAPPLPA